MDPTIDSYNDYTKDNAYIQAVKSALENFTDPAWLGAHSPLAAPYLLGPQLDQHTYEWSATERGQLLKKLIQDAAANLDPELQTILEVVFFNPNRNLTQNARARSLNLSERHFYRGQKEAIQLLAAPLNQLLKPALRLEAPVGQGMIGRQKMLVDIVAALDKGHSVFINGVSGVGKTTLSTAVVNVWQEPQASDDKQLPNTPTHVFWYTIRSGFNDYMANILFAIGFYLRDCGAPRIWQQLLADQGKIQTEYLIGLIRHELQEMAHGDKLLFCIDDVDLLDPDISEHIQIIHLIEEIGQLAPLLLIGQRQTIEANEFFAVTGFTPQEVAQFLQQAQVPNIELDVCQNLCKQVNGNPALLTLFSALYKLGYTVDEGLRMLKDDPSIEALYNRVWRRLKDEEKKLLVRLIVFPDPSPEDAWAKHSETLYHLQQYGLLQRDEHGGIFALPHIRKIGYLRISAEYRPALHQQAGKIWEERNNIIAAMYHNVEAKQPALTVWQWYANRTTEIEQGRAASALTLLQRISSQDLDDPEDRNMLLVARSELFMLLGRSEEAEEDLQKTIVSGKGIFPAYVLQLQAELSEMRGQAERAVKEYRESLELLLSSPAYLEITLRTRMGFLHEYHFQERDKARREALLARIKSEGFHGNVAEMDGHFKLARSRYQSAYELALQLGENDNGSLSRAYSQLGVLEVREGNIDAAIKLIEKAIECDKNRGDIVSPLYDMLNLAYAHAQAENYEKSLEVANSGFKTAQQVGSSYLMAGLSCGVGEAYLGLGQLKEAEHYARISLGLEEAFFRWSVLALLGAIKEQQNHPDDAADFLIQAIECAQQSEDSQGEAQCQEKLAHIYSLTDNIPLACEAYYKSLTLYQSLDLPHKVQEVKTKMSSLGCKHH